ncbi:MAG TPA: winged helix-turn-helix domain-containing protein, partial [Burkholderiales bacterium]|nr:winged helix-turn-helix domain-containing protein [Burkholderiales bacterium]
MTHVSNNLATSYRFADLTLDVARRSVARGGQPIELKALDFDLLRFLAEQAPNVVNADVLAEKVWGRHFVSPENVAQRVMLLRQSLSDDANKPRYIETVRNKGYRLIPVVETRSAPETGGAPQRRWVMPAIAATLLAAVGVTGAAVYQISKTSEPPLPGPGSVAVLPFENLSPNPDDAFFAAAMQDEIVSQLTKISGLRVIPVRPAAGAHRSSDVASRLNVAATLGGSVYYSDGRVRVTPGLTEVATGVSLWSNSYERDLGDIFAIHREIALDVAHALRVELSVSERRRIARVPSVDPRARDLYLRARARLWRDTPAEASLAIQELDQALTYEPAFAEAWVVSSNVHNTSVYYEPLKATDHQARGEQAARRALELDSELGAAHAELGYALSLRKDWKGAETAYRRARSLSVPFGDMPAYSILQLSVGNFAFAREILEEHRAAEPQNPIAHRFL